MEIGHSAPRVDTLRYSRFLLSAGFLHPYFNWAFINLSPKFCRPLTNPQAIRVPSSVFLLSGGLHNESTRKEAGAPGVTEELFEARKSALAMEKANQMKGLCFTRAESAVKVTGVPRLMNSIASLGATFCAFHKGQQATEMRM
ncbi:hypothetical protein IGI04_028393 [Brassica rapa subsp. trilocularis]|uniref:Uncharacterized protein n=1 Tax=Brassica rapa subsp. trilocularis TaxID=1813537 RepID=A0ABQ7L1T8_BRACM|nr:hypothetical protein IGI04_028393 [Brassica rapa subsp. trilocularis]